MTAWQVLTIPDLPTCHGAWIKTYFCWVATHLLPFFLRNWVFFIPPKYVLANKNSGIVEILVNVEPNKNIFFEGQLLIRTFLQVFYDFMFRVKKNTSFFIFKMFHKSRWHYIYSGMNWLNPDR